MPGPSYFIVDYTLAEKMYQISYIGNWDFQKVYLAHNINRLPPEKLSTYLTENSGMEEMDANSLLQEALLVLPEKFPRGFLQGAGACPGSGGKI